MSLSVLQRAIFAVTLSLILQGCQTAKPVNDASSPRVKPPIVAAETVPIPNKWLPMLTEQPLAWRGTPYVLGGTSKTGIDCSGFVHMTFKKHLDKDIPRSTKLLSTYGHRIDHNNARAGDLVFFHTSDTVDHVGIYVSATEFVHASTSKGVIVSKYSNPYWKPRYWQTRRIEL